MALHPASPITKKRKHSESAASVPDITSMHQAPSKQSNGNGKKPSRESRQVSSDEEGDAPLTAKSTGGKLKLENGTINGSSSSPRKKTIRTKQERLAEEERLKENAARLRVEADKLPFNEAKDEIVNEILANDTVIIVAETGSGKSTQLPQLLQTHPTALSHFGRSSPLSYPTSSGPVPSTSRQPVIAITQPRRLPCISLAARVSEEMGVPLGREVGYAVRFESREIMEIPGKIVKGKKKTNVRFCTEGVLLRELSNGPSWNSNPTSKKHHADSLLSFPTESASSAPNSATSTFKLPSTGAQRAADLLLRYDVIVIDEAHERTVNTDMLLGTLKKIQAERKELTRKSRRKEGNQANGRPAKEAKQKEVNGELDGSEDVEMNEEKSLTETSEKEEQELEEDWGDYDMRELKIVVMSATLDADRFSKYFQLAPIIFIKGRQYAVKTFHLDGDDDRDLDISALQTVVYIAVRQPPGDILVFMPGQAEIERLVHLIKQRFNKLIVDQDGEDSKKILEVHALYRNMALQEQAKVLQKSTTGRRKVIVSTNIAETSLTIENIVYVVDSGLQKQRDVDFLSATTITNLRPIPCSQSAARQRTGRAGRTRPGTCFRLYTEKSFLGRETVQKPEIQRAELQSLFLQLVAIGQNPFEFDFIDAPDREAMIQAWSALLTFEAVTKDATMTAVGRRMLHYPIQPSRARILIASFGYACTAEIIDILAVMEAGDPFAKTSDHQASDSARQMFLHRDGDHLTSMQVLRLAMEADARHRADRHTTPTLLRWCKDKSLNLRTLQEAMSIRDQLRKLVQQDGQSPDTSCGAETAPVMRSLLQGQFQYTAKIMPGGGYKQILGALPIKIHPSSTLAGRKAPAFVFDELEITNQVYAHNCSIIDESWMLDIMEAQKRIAGQQ